MLYILDNKTGKIKPFSGTVEKNSADKFLLTKINHKNVCGNIVGADSNYNMVFKVE